MIYLLLRTDSSLFLESEFTAFALLVVISGMGEKISKIRNVSIWIASISMATMVISHSIVNSSDASLAGDWQTSYPIIILSTVAGFLFGPIFWQLSEASYHYIKMRGIGRSTLFAVAIISSVAMVVYVVTNYVSQIMSFLDTHPWIVGLVVPLVTLFLGVIYGRRTKKNQI